MRGHRSASRAAAIILLACCMGLAHSSPVEAWTAPIEENLPAALLNVVDREPTGTVDSWSRAFVDQIASTVPVALVAQWGRTPGSEELANWARTRLAELYAPDSRGRFRRQIRRNEQCVARWRRRLDRNRERGVLFTLGGEIRVVSTSVGSAWVFPLDRLSETPDETVIASLVARALQERAPWPDDLEPRWKALRTMVVQYRVFETLNPGPGDLTAWSGLDSEQIRNWQSERRSVIRNVQEAWHDARPIDAERERFTLALGLTQVLRHHTWEESAGWDVRGWEQAIMSALDTL